MKTLSAVLASLLLSGCAFSVGGKLLRLGPSPEPRAQAVAQEQNTPVAAARPLERSKAEPPAQTKAEPTAEERASVPGRAAQKLLGELKAQVRKGETIGVEKVTELEKLGTEAETLLANSGRAYLDDAAWLRTLIALSQPDGSATVAAQFRGKVVASGDGGRELSVKVKAKSDACYVLLGAFRSFDGPEKLDRADTEGPASLRAFALNLPFPSLVGHGFCASVAGQHTLTSKATITGTQNGLRYVVMEFERESLSKRLALTIDLELPDRCDPDAWERALLKPISGTLAWDDAEPVLLLNSYPGASNSANCARLVDDSSRLASGRSCHGSNADFKSRMAAKPIFKPFTLAQCPNKKNDRLPRGEASRKLLACEAAIAKKYEAGWKQVDRMTVKLAADRKAEQLRNAFDDDYEKQCRPLFVQARKNMEARYNKLVDSLSTNPPADRVDRVETNASLRRW